MASSTSTKLDPKDYGLKIPENKVPPPVGPQDVTTLIDDSLANQPDKTALVGRHRRLTFAELEGEINAAAAYLSALGLREGDRIAASIGNHPEIVVAFLAAQRLGAIWFGINRNYSVPEKMYQIDDAHPRLILAEAQIVEELAAANADLGEPCTFVTVDPSGGGQWANGMAQYAGAGRPDVAINPWTPAGIAYTSGTTGRPKGAVHSQHNMIVAATIASLVAGDQRLEAIRGCASPLTILNMMIGGPLSALSAGNTLVCMDRVDVGGIAEWIAAEKINTLALVPTMIQDLLTSPDVAPDQLQSLTWVVVGAAMVPEGMATLYEARFGHKPTVGYGLTENPTVISRTHDKTPAVLGAIGRPMRHLEVRILDDEDNCLPAGETGEICVRATTEGEWAHVYTPSLGYWRNAEATEKLLRNGWLHTGDIGMIDADGELYIQSRRSDLIVRGGANIYPAEIERVIRQNPDVVDCAVLGAPDSRLGEVPAAFVQVSADVDSAALLEDLQRRCATELARYKVPVFWKTLDDLPRNAMGKIVKDRLRHHLESSAA